jgi:hypothetical protein
MKRTALAILSATATTYHAQLLRIEKDHAVFEVAPPTVSGRPAMAFRIRVDAIGDELVKSREDEPILLPCSCPERHINIDGSFCLYWAEAEPNKIIDENSAGVWWGKLLIFLKRQRIAAAHRRWPGKFEARAHGADAARAQQSAELTASELGPRFRNFLDEGRLASTRKNVGDDSRLRLMLDGERLVTVRQLDQRLMTKRSRCKCDNARSLRLPICNCGNHETTLTDLTVSLNRWKVEEDKFLRAYVESGAKCCGTIDDCPLNA